MTGPVRSATEVSVRPVASDTVTNVARRWWTRIGILEAVRAKSSARVTPAFARCSPAWVVDLLDIQLAETVLEIGPGPGLGLELAALRAGHGRVVGVDPSETMLEMARRRNRAQVEAGRVELLRGAVDRIPLDDGSFDAAMTINSVHLWPDALRGLAEVARVLRPGGRVALGISRYSYASPDAFEQLLGSSGFHGGHRPNREARHVRDRTSAAAHKLTVHCGVERLPAPGGRGS